MVLPDELEILEGQEIDAEWYAYEVPLDVFLVQTLEEAQADAIGLVMRSSIADGLITDDEILRVSPALAARHWRAGLHVETGDVYAYGDALWRCVQQHITQANWTPDVITSLWRKVEPSEGARVWTTAMDYAVDDIVHYPDLHGPLFRCITPHTSQHGWEPPNAPALWESYTAEDTPEREGLA